MRKQPQKIYGYVDLTDEMKIWMKDQVVNKGSMNLAMGWRVFPAHHRGSTTKQIIMKGYPDCEDSHFYWFLNPNKRDQVGDIINEPLPIMSERDKEFFHEQNSKMRDIHGFLFYKIMQSSKNYTQEYRPEDDFVIRGGKGQGARPAIAEDIGHEVKDIQVPVTAAKKRGRPKKVAAVV